MANDEAQRARDAEAHRKTYDAIMKATGEVGVPGSLALAMFFTNLVMGHSFWLALLAGILTYIAVFFVIRTFFAH
ncbi:MAG TPA: hypothetical protein VNH64_00160 [Parvularculaceae bacterium]|nr:hypothetical protein [Parvularculaceae bacterium]